MKEIVSKALCVWFTALLVLVPLVHAEEASIALITEPLYKIYDLVKAIITIVAILAITFAGAKN